MIFRRFGSSIVSAFYFWNNYSFGQEAVFLQPENICLFYFSQRFCQLELLFYVSFKRKILVYVVKKMSRKKCGPAVEKHPKWGRKLFCDQWKCIETEKISCCCSFFFIWQHNSNRTVDLGSFYSVYRQVFEWISKGLSWKGIC